MVTVEAQWRQKVPNALTLLRVLIIPVFVVFLLNPSSMECQYAFWLFTVASLTDWLDGYLARLWRVESKIGALFDPLADKLLVMAALVMLTQVPEPRNIPSWLVVTLLAREMCINGLRSFAALEGLVVPASTYAKHKTAWTMLAIAALLWGEVIQLGPFSIDVVTVGFWSLGIALIFSITTGIAYFMRLSRLLW